MKKYLLLILFFQGHLLSAQVFEELLEPSPFEHVSLSAVAFSDIDNDGDKDVLITGYGNSGPIAKLYTNEGNNVFTEVLNTPFEGVYNGSVRFSDVDGDGDEDLVITGATGAVTNYIPIAKLYINEEGQFTWIPNTPFLGVSHSSIAFSDVDGDGDEDLLITGNYHPIDLYTTRLYLNEDGIFIEDTDTPFEDVSFGSVAFADIDNDGDKDVVITGDNGMAPIAKLYTNEEGAFSEVVGGPFFGVKNGSIAFSDIDNDGDEDLIITGYNDSVTPFRSAKLYINEMGVFSEVFDTPFDGVNSSSVAFADIDNDGDKDLLITGSNNSVEKIAKLYLNDEGEFNELITPVIEGVRHSSIAFSDIDNDDDMDLLITGINSSSERSTKLYTNNTITTSNFDLLSTNDAEILIFPNPTRSNTVRFKINLMSANHITVKMMDINGHIVVPKRKFNVSGEQDLQYNISGLSDGIYIIEFDYGSGKLNKKLLITKE